MIPRMDRGRELLPQKSLLQDRIRYNLDYEERRRQDLLESQHLKQSLVMLLDDGKEMKVLILEGHRKLR